jgi:hypothetical protein
METVSVAPLLRSKISTQKYAALCAKAIIIFAITLERTFRHH